MSVSGWKNTRMQPDAGERLGLDVLDAVDGRRHGALGERHHAALDLGRREARELPDDRDDRDVDARGRCRSGVRTIVSPPTIAIRNAITMKV